MLQVNLHTCVSSPALQLPPVSLAENHTCLIPKTQGMGTGTGICECIGSMDFVVTKGRELAIPKLKLAGF